MMKERLDIQAKIKELIDKNCRTYENDSSRIISDFRGEKQTTDDYRGRQLLELLQNADDAATDKTIIELDTNSQKLVVANNGLAFDLKGVQSLLIANTSSKTKKEFIGNKGLGFRSILNWTTEINIKTKHFVLTFSPEIARKRFEEFVPDIADRADLIKENHKYLSKGEVPFSILAMPECSTNDENQTSETIIELTYNKKDEQEILEQLNTISPCILLFLNHTDKIEIIGTDNLNKVIERQFLNESKTHIRINYKKWHIYNSGELTYPNVEDIFYQFKIAWQDDLSDEDSLFFNYFPTEVHSNLPFLIHATFELNQSRNELLKGETNQFLLKQIAQTISEIAISKIRIKGESNWNAYRFLEPSSISSNNKLHAFYEKLFELQKELEIYPCVDGSYCTKENAIYYGAEFSDWVIRNGVEKEFSNLLKHIPEVMSGEIPTKKYTTDELVEHLEQALNTYDISIKERIVLLRILLDTEFTALQKSDFSISILLEESEENQFNPIPSDIQAFISNRDFRNFNIPVYSRMKVLSMKMYDQMLEAFESEIKEQKSSQTPNEHVSRPLKRVVDKIVNIGSNDITHVINNIIASSQTEYNDNNYREVIHKMVDSLYLIYCDNPGDKRSMRVNVPLLNRKGEISQASELYFGSGYKSGDISEYLFEDVYNEGHYLQSIELWNLTSIEGILPEEFFKWLGVNEYCSIRKVLSPIVIDWKYKNFIKKVYNLPNGNKEFLRSGYEIQNINEVGKLCLEKLLLLVHYKENLLKNLDSTEILKYEYYGTKELHNCPSYVKFQLNTKFHFNKILIGTDLDLGGDYSIVNTGNDAFFRFPDSPKKNELSYILTKLGALESYLDLKPFQIIALIENFASTETNAAGSQTFYKKLFDYFVKHKEDKFEDYESPFGETLLFSRKGGTGNNIETKKANELYYSDNKLLPDSILQKYWFINLPKRIGEQNVKGFFGVKLIKDLIGSINIIKPGRNKVLTDELMQWVDKIKVHFLCYRLMALKKESDFIKAANSIKALNIVVHKSCTFSFDDDKHELDENSFIKHEDIFHIKTNVINGIEALQNDPGFCDAIAEIICIVFEVKENKNRYRSIFKDTLQETKHLIKEDELTKYFNQASELLGVSIHELAFWTTVLTDKGKELPEQINHSDELMAKINELLDFEVPESYSNISFDDFSNVSAVELIAKLIGEQKVSYAQLLTNRNVLKGLLEYHKQKMSAVVNLKDNQDLITQFVWHELSEASTENKKKFNGKINQLKQDILRELNTHIENDNSLELDYPALFLEHFNTNYAINTIVDIKEIFNRNLVALGNPDISDIDDALKSLYYFEWDNIDELKNIALPAVTVEVTPNGINEPELDNVEIIESDISAVIVNEKNGGSNGGNGSGGAHSQSHDRNKRRKGKAAEKLVRDKLIASGYENVSWVSGNSDEPSRDDTLGYDIRYTDKDGEEIFLEVKAISSDNSFFISEDEKECGEKYKNKYVMALVIGETIHFVKDFFKFDNDETFDHNKKYTVKRSNYKVHFKVK